MFWICKLHSTLKNKSTNIKKYTENHTLKKINQLIKTNMRQ